MQSTPANEGWSRQWFNRLALRPFGRTLCTPMAGFWIFCTRLAILIMATSEAISWGYLGFFFGSGFIRLLSAAFVGISVFTIVWLIDATFMTLDIDRALYEKTIMGKQPDKYHTESLKTVAGLLGRVGIISASLLISAPFLAQIIFAKDIDAMLAKENSRRIADARAKVEDKHNNFITAANNRLTQAQQQVVVESAGKGPSRRYGRGSVVQTIEAQLPDLKAAVERAGTAKTDELAQFDSLTPEQVARRYGVEFAGAGLQARGEALQRLLENPSYTKAELAVRAFLAFLFASMIILKLFSPRSVRIYFNERLQDLYQSYRAGTFDRWLPKEEQSTATEGKLWPLRFEEWCVNTYSVVLDDDRRKRQYGNIVARYRAKADGLLELLTEAKKERDALRDDHTHLVNERLDLQNRLSHLEPRRATLHAQAEDAHRELGELDAAIDAGKVQVSGFVQAINMRDRLRTQLSALAAEHGEVSAESEAIDRQLRIVDNEIQVLETTLVAKEVVISDMESKVGEQRTSTAQQIHIEL